MKHLIATFLLLAALVLGTQLSADPLVVRKSVRSNPTIALSGSTGSAELDTALQRFVAACGWFDAVRGEADYLLELKRDLRAAVNSTSRSAEPRSAPGVIRAVPRRARLPKARSTRSLKNASKN